jgi:hypothetical protein
VYHEVASRANAMMDDCPLTSGLPKRLCGDAAAPELCSSDCEEAPKNLLFGPTWHEICPS